MVQIHLDGCEGCCDDPAVDDEFCSFDNEDVVASVSISGFNSASEHYFYDDADGVWKLGDIPPAACFDGAGGICLGGDADMTMECLLSNLNGAFGGGVVTGTNPWTATFMLGTAGSLGDPGVLVCTRHATSTNCCRHEGPDCTEFDGMDMTSNTYCWKVEVGFHSVGCKDVNKCVLRIDSIRFFYQTEYIVATHQQCAGDHLIPGCAEGSVMGGGGCGPIADLVRDSICRLPTEIPLFTEINYDASLLFEQGLTEADCCFLPGICSASAECDSDGSIVGTSTNCHGTNHAEGCASTPVNLTVILTLVNV